MGSCCGRKKRTLSCTKIPNWTIDLRLKIEGEIAMRDYKNVKAYQLAYKLVIEIYKVTKNFPNEETYGLTSQLRRAAVSIAANIVEGASRQHKRDYLNFLYTSRGSLAETEYLLNLSNSLSYIDNSIFQTVEKLKNDAAKTLFGLIDAVNKEI